MKKNISVISMDSVLQEWLLQKLIKEPPESDSAKELLSGIYDMVSGEINSLLLSTANNSEIASLNLSDEMKIGELVINPKSSSVSVLHSPTDLYLSDIHPGTLQVLFALHLLPFVLPLCSRLNSFLALSFIPYQ